MDTKINILYEFRPPPWGGGNQFLESLKNYLSKNNSYAENIEEADVVIFNSHHGLSRVIRAKLKNPGKIFVHRLDNLMSIARGNGKEIDSLIAILNRKVADGTIFQSQWCRNRFYEYGIKSFDKYTATIHNAPDSFIFYPGDALSRIEKDRKFRLIATSWSDNPRKGFSLYSYLDENLNFDKYSMTFVGNSPVNFRSIKQIPALPSHQLAEILREHDIFISGSLNEACPNALIEAMHCGLVPVVINSGSHSELVQDQGIIFNDVTEALAAVNKATENLEYYKKKLHPETIYKVGKEYSKFCRFIAKEVNSKNYINKKINILDAIFIEVKILIWKIKGYLRVKL